MATVEERMAFVEGRTREHSQMFMGIRETIAGLEQRMDRRFDALDQKIERQIAGLDLKLEQKVTGLDARLDALRQEMSSHQRWLVGLQVTTLLVVIGAAFAR